MKLDANDFLTHQLYTASKTQRIVKARARSWILTTVIFLFLAFLCFESGNDVLGYYFAILSVLSLTLYPVYSRWKYKRHYKKYIEDTYKNRFDEESTLEISENIIFIKDRTGEGKINTSEVEEINEIKDFYFIKIRTGVSIIISKGKTEAHELEVIEKALKQLVDKRGIKHNIELGWKWR